MKCYVAFSWLCLSVYFHGTSCRSASLASNEANSVTVTENNEGEHGQKNITQDPNHGDGIESPRISSNTELNKIKVNRRKPPNMRQQIDDLQQQIKDLQRSHEIKLQAINNQHKEEIKNINNKRKDEIKNINNEHKEEINNMNNAHKDKIAKLNRKIGCLMTLLTSHSKSLVSKKPKTTKKNVATVQKRSTTYADVKRLEAKLNKVRSDMNDIRTVINNLTIYMRSDIGNLKVQRDKAQSEKIDQLLIRVGRLTQKLKLERRQKIICAIMPLMRWLLEIDEVVYFPPLDVTREEMLEAVKHKIPKQTFGNSSQISIHLLRWLYIFTFSTSSDVRRLKEFVKVHLPDLNDYMTAEYLSDFYSHAPDFHFYVPDKMPGTMESLTLDEIEMALRQNGVTDKSTLLLLKAIYAIPRGIKEDQILLKGDELLEETRK